MKFFLIICLFFYGINLFAQKSIIDSIAYKKWPSLGEPIISNNGKYVIYSIKNRPIEKNTLVVQATDNKWEKEFEGLRYRQMVFSDRYLIFVNDNDSLGILTLGTNIIKYITRTPYFKLQKTEEGEYITYMSENNPKVLVLRNLKTYKESSFEDVDRWSCDKEMLVLIKSINGDDEKQSINLVNLSTNMLSEIWEGINPENLVMDSKHRQIAFKSGDSVLLYKSGRDKAFCIAKRDSTSEKNGLELGDLDSFSRDGKFLFTSLVERNRNKPVKECVEIWSYTDLSLQTEQELKFGDQRYMAVIDVMGHKIIRLQQQIEEYFHFSKFAQDTLALIENNQRFGEPWSIGCKSIWSLILIKNGKRQRLNFLDKKINITLSPCGKYLTYFDEVLKDFFSYEIAGGKIQNLTKGLCITSPDLLWDNGPGINRYPRGLAAWTENDESILFYDQYDIWKLDPQNAKKPINITNSYGKRHQIIFHLGLKEYNEKSIKKHAELIINSFDLRNKENGYYKKRVDKNGDPNLLVKGPYIFDLINAGYLPGDVSFYPCKAKDEDMYIIRKMSANEAPNYYSTKDFKSFKRLTNLNFEKLYNWYSSELCTWKSFDNRNLQGILYKPENFDPNKKYPVIFHYYQLRSNGLNSYIYPESISNGGCINIPTYTSQGYLVFSPDIYYEEGNPMQGTYDAVVSAAEYLSKLSFVDPTKMALQGHSFGGFQTNYLVSHTNLFVAAASSSGISNWVSVYGSLDVGSQQDYFENGQGRIGGSLWEKPDAFIRSSPIFQLDKIVTPLLIMHTRNDTRCPYTDALAFFTGLRRLGKKAWMLVYSESNHGVFGKEADDFGIRMMQFFDHYLKNKPAPIWMLNGIPGSQRGFNHSLQLDVTGKTPGSGLLTPLEQQKVNCLINRKPLTIILK